MNGLFCAGIRKQLWDDFIIRSKLESLAQADKTKNWICTDLSTPESSCSGRLFWTVIAKRFDCLRQLYDINPTQSTAILEQLSAYIEANQKDDLKPLYLSALSNFGFITGHQPALMPYNANPPQEPQEDGSIVCCPIVGGPPLIEVIAPPTEPVIDHIVTPIPPFPIIQYPVAIRPRIAAGRLVSRLGRPVRQVIASVPSHRIPVTIRPVPGERVVRAPLPSVPLRVPIRANREMPAREIRAPMPRGNPVPIAPQHQRLPQQPITANRTRVPLRAH